MRPRAGWKETDYRIEGASLHFHGVTRIDAGASGNELKVAVSRPRRR